MATFGDTDLVLTEDLPYRQEIFHEVDGAPVSWDGYAIRMEARLRDGTLVGLLDPFLAVDLADPTKMVLELPDFMVNALARFGEARWDLLALSLTDPQTSFRVPTPAGRIVILRGVTRA